MEKKILITGAKGFLGRATCAALNDSYPDATLIMSNRSDTDLTLLNDVEALLQAAEPDIVVHLAGMWGGQIFARHWNADSMWANSLMFLNLIGAAAHNKVTKFITVLPSIAYSANLNSKANESQLDIGGFPGNYAGFGNFARFTVQGCKTFAWQYGLEFSVLILPEVYGPRGNFTPENSNWLHSAIREIKNARDRAASSVTLQGSEDIILPHLYVEDAASLVAKCVQSDTKIMNLIGGEASLGEISKKICSLFNYNGSIKWDEAAMAEPSDIPIRLDVTQMKSLGFTAEFDLDAGLRKTISSFS